MNPQTFVFEEIGWQDGAGDCNTPKNYSFPDHDVESSVDYFYRLRQVDLNGEEFISEIVSARIDMNGNAGIYVVPNPGTGTSILNVNMAGDDEIQLELYSTEGNLVAVKTVHSGTSGSLTLRLDQIFFIEKDGLYTIKASSKTRSFSCKALIFNSK